ncbi:MAG TPA: replication-associated recombination protein A [Edaphocola sp.]|nr:replication-associated recombination protein A [Edaphocola sp.]
METGTTPSKPLAERMRPESLATFIGQENLTGEGKIIWQMIRSGQPASMIFWGPPGVGKTTLANIIARETQMPFFQLSAIDSGVKEVRQAIEMARRAGKAILFIDEIHRFNKAQQDSLLGAVEKGIIVLIGATTENPSFEVISALLSRCQVYVLEPFSEEELKRMVQQALDNDHWLKSRKLRIEEWGAFIRLSGGDGRRILNLLEIVAQNVPEGATITNDVVQAIIQQNLLRFDKSGEQHYDLISAFIKSIRGSDPNAAVYYLARMIEGGEDPKFIARRMVILSSEDIGNANPNALLIATQCFQAVSIIGYPECRIILSQTAVYLACSVKSNATYLAIGKAQELVRKSGNLPVPLHLRNAPTKLMKNLDYGKGYAYAHDFDGNFAVQEFLPEEVIGTVLYEPGANPAEEKTRAHLRQCWKEKYGY